MIGDEFGEGRRICEEKVAQYFWSGVRAASEAGSLIGARGATSVAIVEDCSGLRESIYGGIDFVEVAKRCLNFLIDARESCSFFCGSASAFR